MSDSNYNGKGSETEDLLSVTTRLLEWVQEELTMCKMVTGITNEICEYAGQYINAENPFDHRHLRCSTSHQSRMDLSFGRSRRSWQRSAL